MTTAILTTPAINPLLVPIPDQSNPITSYEALAGLIDSLEGLLKTQRQVLNPLDRVEVDLLSEMAKRILQRNGFPVAGAEPIFQNGILNTPGNQLTQRETLYKCLLNYGVRLQFHTKSVT